MLNKLIKIGNILMNISFFIFSIGLLAIAIFFPIYLYMEYNKKDTQIENSLLRQELDTKDKVIIYLQDRVDKLEHNLTSINEIHSSMLTPNLKFAKYTYEASVKYDIEPLILTSLINSESAYKNVVHKHSKVKGMAGIHTGFWNIPNTTSKEQIEAGAYVLRVYLDKYNGNYLKAITAYKGVSPKGKRQAKLVLDKANYEY